MPRFFISSRTLRTLCAAGFVAAAVLFTQSQDALREITRPIVLGILQTCGIHTEDRGDVMAVGHLEIPWTRDCAGINLLLIMLALAVWVNREEPVVLKFWLRVAAMLPAALAANVLRVLCLIGYRFIAYPAVESPQTHYFLGFIAMVPFITLITPRAGRPAFHALLETLHAAAVIALLAPMTGMPNGSLLAVAVVLALSQCRVRQDRWNWRLPLTFLWVVAGAAVALMNMESFWLPWLLCCPLLLDFKWLFSPAGILVMLSTQSMFTMQSWAPLVGWTGIGLALWSWVKKSPAPTDSILATPTPPAASLQRVLAGGAACCFLIPFLASTLLSVGQASWKPPVAVESRSLGSQGYEVRLPGQPETIALACYGAEGKDRHHTVQVCLKYRGTDLAASLEHPAVYTDGEHWLREFFLQDGQLLADYPAYLKSTFRPGSDPGVHLIFISPMESGTPQAFATTSATLAASFYQLSLDEPSPQK
jgi:exosortase/archaeosortase family protein